MRHSPFCPPSCVGGGIKGYLPLFLGCFATRYSLNVEFSSCANLFGGYNKHIMFGLNTTIAPKGFG
jgi:hypothetical protein